MSTELKKYKPNSTLEEFLNPENFRTWLLDKCKIDQRLGDKIVVGETAKGDCCPIYNFLFESDYRINGVGPIYIKMIKEVIPLNADSFDVQVKYNLPEWAKKFVEKIDAKWEKTFEPFSKRVYVTAAEAIEILNSVLL